MPWTIVTSPWFATRLQKHEDDLRLRLRKLRTAHWPQPATDLFVPEAEEFNEFKSGLRDVTPANPLSKLEFFSVDSNGQRYYRLLGDGDWRAYYVIEEESVVALTLLNRTSSRKKILAELELAIKEYRKGNG